MKQRIKRLIEVCKRPKYIPIIQPKTDSLLAGKTALIVGGCGGIGFAIAKEFAESGCKVIITGTSEEKLKKYSTELGDVNYKIFHLLDFDNYDKLVNEIVCEFGKVDILVNAAGTHTDYPGFDFFNIKPEEFDRVISINLKASYFLAQSFGNYFIKEKIKGHILFISSQRGLEPSWSPYRISKRALDGIVAGVAKKLIPYGIVVNGIAPGSTNTKLIGYEAGDSIASNDNPTERLCVVEEVATFAKMLASDVGNMVVGQVLSMSGGGGIIEIK